MLFSRLESLPIELLRDISVHLDAPGRHHLQAFALASKVCHVATVACLFRTITITIRSPLQTESKLERWKDTLEKSCSFKHVRCLTLTDYEPPDPEDLYDVPARLDTLADPDDPFVEPSPRSVRSYRPMGFSNKA